MRGLRSVSISAHARVRRWDAIVLGGSLPGLVTAVRLAMDGMRVLVVEEDTAVRAFRGLREPFSLVGARAGGVLDACLRELTIPLIDRRRLEPDPVAYQVVLPDARVDVGEAALTADELVAWGFAKPDAASEIVRALVEASTAEGEAMLSSPVERIGRRRLIGSRLGRNRHRSVTGAKPDRETDKLSRFGRGLPQAVAAPPPRVATFFDAQVRALSNLAESSPSPEARARLLGAPLAGCVSFAGSDPGLRELLRRRIRSLHCDLRSLGEPFELISVAGEPGLALSSANEVWAGRTLIINVPRPALARGLRQNPLPRFLEGPPATRQRLALHFQASRFVVPDGMSRRVICVTDSGRPMDGTNVVTIGVFPRAQGDERVDLVAAAVVGVDGEDLGARAAEIEATLRRLTPFAGDRLERLRVTRPTWDDDSLLVDPRPGRGWPAETDVRVSSRPPIHALDRQGTAALGVEGDALLGWRAAEAIRESLG